MKRRGGVLLLVLFLVGCTAVKQPPGEPSEPAPQAAEAAPEKPAPDPGLPARPPENPLRGLKPGTWISGDQVGLTLGYTVTPSPDGNWIAELAGEPIGTHTLVVFAADRSKAWVVEPEYSAYGDTQPQWTNRNTLIYYQQYGRESHDSWFEADPTAGRIDPFLPEILSGRSAGRVRFSPDGTRLLVGTGFCNGCNKPSEVAVTTYLVDLVRGTAQELGVDVDATWDGDQVTLVAEEPHMGYSGPIFYNPDGDLRRPLAEGIQIGGTDYVEWRAYRLDAAPGEPPFKVIPAFDRADTYNIWEFWWPDPPAGPFRLEVWALVRPTVPDRPEAQVSRQFAQELRWEGDQRWAVVYSRDITLTSDDPPRQTVTLHTIRMWDAASGWGVDWAGRIMRTVDGGNTWRDVSPAGFDRCAGRYAPRYAHELGAGTATVAMACDQTGPDGKWTRESGRVDIFRTTDGGTTWSAASIETAYRFANPTSLQFADLDNGWAVVRPAPSPFGDAGGGALYRTTDGGQTWQQVSDTESGLPSALQVSFRDAKRGWAVGARSASLWATEDGGATWRAVPVDVSLYADWGSISPPVFITPQEGYYVSGGWLPEQRESRRELYWTTDGGVTWEKRSEWQGYANPAFLTTKVGYVWEYEFGTIKWTRDGGRTWEDIQWLEGRPLKLHFVDEQHGFAAQGLIRATSDGGRTWTELLPQAQQ